MIMVTASACPIDDAENLKFQYIQVTSINGAIMNKVTKLNWQKGKPKSEGLYFVAIKLGEAAGNYDLINWANGRWEVDYQQEVVAFIGYSEFLNQLNIEWPLAQTDKQFSNHLPD